MKKLLSLVLAALFGLSALWSGGQAEEQTAAVAAEPVASATEAGTPGAPVKLRALIGSWNTMASSVEERKNYYEAALLAWAENHPDVYVEIEGIPGGQTAQAMTKLITAALAGNPHDFANVDSQWVGNFHEAGALVPIDAYVPAADKQQFFEFTEGVTMRDGKLYSLWAETGTLLYYYDTNLAPTAPRTWQDVFALGEKLEGSDVSAFMTQGKGAAAAFCLLPFYWSQGGILFDPADDYRPVFGEGRNRAAMVNTLRFLQELIDAGAMSPEMVGYAHDELQAEALAGNLATMVAGSWKASGLPENWQYTSMPMPQADQYSNIYGGWTFSFLAKDEKKLEESVNFVMEVYTNEDAMADRLPRHGYIPTRKDVFSADAFKSPFYDQIYKELEIGRARPATSLYPEMESQLEEAVGRVVTGSDVEKIVDDMYKDLMAAYEDMN